MHWLQSFEVPLMRCPCFGPMQYRIDHDRMVDHEFGVNFDIMVFNHSLPQLTKGCTNRFQAVFDLFVNISRLWKIPLKLLEVFQISQAPIMNPNQWGKDFCIWSLLMVGFSYLNVECQCHLLKYLSKYINDSLDFHFQYSICCSITSVLELSDWGRQGLSLWLDSSESK